MSTREKFEKWRRQRLTMDGYPTYSAEDAWKAAWEMSRAVALEEALTAVIAERLEDSTKNPDDIAYDMGVDDCADAIRALAKDGEE